jgi:hypothetical protein
LLVQLRKNNLSEQMGLLSLSYTKAINKRRERCGPLFQGPFRSIPVAETDYLLNLSRYIHLNPVKAGFVDQVEDWEFSSYRDYVELRPGTLPQFGAVRQQVGDARAYQGFMMGSDRTPTKMRGLLLDE